MAFKRNAALKKSKRPGSTTVLYIGAIIVTIIGVAYLVTNIILFQKTVAQYTAQGYPAATVISQLLPSQLLPGIYEPIGVYGGIALILFGAGIINHKISKCLSMDSGAETEDFEVGDNDIDTLASETNVVESKSCDPEPELNETQPIETQPPETQTNGQ